LWYKAPAGRIVGFIPQAVNTV